MKNRLFALLLALVMTLTYMPLMAFAADESGTDGQVRAEASGEGVSAEAAEPDVKVEMLPEGQAVKEDPSCSENPFRIRAENGTPSGEEAGKEGNEKKGRSGKIRAASVDWVLDEYSITLYFDKEYAPYYLWIYGESLYDTPTVSSSNTNVVETGEVEYRFYDSDGYNYRVPLYRNGGGKATITVRDYYGNAQTCAVTAGRTPSRLNYKSYTFNKKHPYSSIDIYNKYWGKDRELVRAKSSNRKVATAKVSYGSVVITPKRKGKATITVRDRTGKVSKIRIKVDKSWKKANLKFYSSASVYYSDKRAYIYSKPHTKFTVRIGGRKFSKKTNKYGYCHINLKKHYRLNTKYSVTFRKRGVRCTVKGKVKSDTTAWLNGTIYTCRSYVPVVVYNAVKGDTLYVNVNGTTYKQKITYTGTFTTTIWTNSSLGYLPYIKYVVRNKYKQTLYRHTEYITWN